MTYFQKNPQNAPTPDTKPTIQSFNKKVSRIKTKRVNTGKPECSSNKVLTCNDCEYTCEKTHTLYMHKQRKHRLGEKTDNGIYEKFDLPKHVKLNGLSSSLQTELAGLFQCDEDWDDNLPREILEEDFSGVAHVKKNAPVNVVLENASEELQNLKKDIGENKPDRAVPDMNRVKEEEDGNILDKKSFDDGEGTNLFPKVAIVMEDLTESMTGKESIKEVAANKQGRKVVDVKFEQDEYLDVTDVKRETEPSAIHIGGQEFANVQLRQEDDELEEENDDVIFISQRFVHKTRSVKEEEEFLDAVEFLEQIDNNDAVDNIFNSDNQDETTFIKETPPNKKAKLELISKSKNSFRVGAEKEICEPNIEIDEESHANIVIENNHEKELKSDNVKIKRVVELMKKLGKQALELKAKESPETYSSEKVKPA